MKFSTGELARMLGLTNEGVRYLERVGIIRAHRDRENGYRSFEFDELVRLTQTRNLRALGFSLEEARSVLDGEMPLSETGTLFSRKMEDLQQRKRELELMEKNLLARMRAIEMLEAGERAYHFVQPAPMVFCPRTRNGKAIRYQKDILEANALWSKATLRACMMAVFYGNGEVVKGLEVPEEAFAALDLPRMSNLIEIRPGRCAHGAIEAPTRGWPDFDRIGRWVRSQGEEPTGDLYCITRLEIRMEDGRPGCVHEYFAPIREKDGMMTEIS